MKPHLNRLLFMDSGAHGLYNEHVSGKVHEKSKYQWFTTKEFWRYVDTYAKFVKEHEASLSVFANVDVIFNPKLSWEVQEYLEREWDIRPLPVIHHGTPLKWLEKYLEKEYEYIGLGGRAQDATQKDYVNWADASFDVICSQRSRLPLAKVHGFAVTAHNLMCRYPWYSVDSKSWISFGGYGMVIHPLRKDGKWDYSRPYQVVRLSIRPVKNNKLSIVYSRTHEVNKVFLSYIEEKGYIIGKSKWADGKETVIEPGLCNSDRLRCELNGLYFIDLVSNLPQWPWPFYYNKKLF